MNKWMLTLGCLLVSIIAIWLGTAHDQELSFSTTPTAFGILKGQEIVLHHGDEIVGEIKYLKIPCFRWYIILDFYVEPQHRNKGYGKLLLQHTIKEIITAKATKIFIQPGPFENNGAPDITEPERIERMQRLVKLYESFLFAKVDNSFVCAVARCMYKIMGVDEDPQFLMVRSLCR